MTKSLTYPERNIVFVCSFLEEGDLLTQWKGYCSPGPGFSIGFTKKILPLALEQGFFAVPCIYDFSFQSKVIQTLIDWSLSLFKEACEKEDVVRIPGGIPVAKEAVLAQVLSVAFFVTLSIWAPALKHPSFSEEKEWRLIMHVGREGNPNCQYRKGSSFVVPYYNFRLQDEAGRLPLSKIIVGPTAHRDLSRNSVLLFLKPNGITECGVQNSRVPFRNW